MSTGEKVKVLYQSRYRSQRIVFQENNKIVVGRSEQISVWNIKFEQEILSFYNQILNYSKSDTTLVQISSNGEMAAIYTQLKNSSYIRLWDIQSIRQIGVLNQKNIIVKFQSIEFSPNGKFLLALGNDNIIYFWKLYKFQQMAQAYNENIFPLQLSFPEFKVEQCLLTGASIIPLNGNNLINQFVEKQFN